MNNKGFGVIEAMLLITAWGGLIILTKRPVAVSVLMIAILAGTKLLAENLSNKLDREDTKRKKK